MHDTSREAYETATARNNVALHAWRRAREAVATRATAAAKEALSAAKDELYAADAALCEHEAAPGVPLYRNSRVPGYHPPGYDPPGCKQCDATYTELDDDGHCVNSGACGRRRQARDAAKVRA